MNRQLQWILVAYAAFFSTSHAAAVPLTSVKLANCRERREFGNADSFIFDLLVTAKSSGVGKKFDSLDLEGHFLQRLTGTATPPTFVKFKLTVDLRSAKRFQAGHNLLKMQGDGKFYKGLSGQKVATAVVSFGADRAARGGGGTIFFSAEKNYAANGCSFDEDNLKDFMEVWAKR